jgi:hypothetical protein
MVEQSIAASASLAMDVVKLRDLVAQFKLHSAASMQSTALRQVKRVMGEPPHPPIRTQQPVAPGKSRELRQGHRQRLPRTAGKNSEPLIDDFSHFSIKVETLFVDPVATGVVCTLLAVYVHRASTFKA